MEIDEAHIKAVDDGNLNSDSKAGEQNSGVDSENAQRSNTKNTNKNRSLGTKVLVESKEMIFSSDINELDNEENEVTLDP